MFLYNVLGASGYNRKFESRVGRRDFVVDYQRQRDFRGECRWNQECLTVVTGCEFTSYLLINTILCKIDITSFRLHVVNFYLLHYMSTATCQHRTFWWCNIWYILELDVIIDKLKSKPLARLHWRRMADWMRQRTNLAEDYWDHPLILLIFRHFIRFCVRFKYVLVHCGSWLSGIAKPKDERKYNWVGKVRLCARISDWWIEYNTASVGGETFLSKWEEDHVMQIIMLK